MANLSSSSIFSDLSLHFSEHVGLTQRAEYSRLFFEVDVYALPLFLAILAIFCFHFDESRLVFLGFAGAGVSLLVVDESELEELLDELQLDELLFEELLLDELLVDEVRFGLSLGVEGLESDSLMYLGASSVDVRFSLSLGVEELESDSLMYVGTS